jgi:hypothetical protein
MNVEALCSIVFLFNLPSRAKKESPLLAYPPFLLHSLLYACFIVAKLLSVLPHPRYIYKRHLLLQNFINNYSLHLSIVPYHPHLVITLLPFQKEVIVFNDKNQES